MVDKQDSIKIVVVGDGAVGKTCMIISFAKNTFPEDYVPTVQENLYIDIDFEGNQIPLGIWDTAGQEEYDKLRPTSYPGTNVFIVCYSVVAPASLNNVEKKWVPEIRSYNSKAPIILVGTKTDMRDEMIGSTALTPEDGLRVMDKYTIQAASFFECSAKTQYGLKDIFKEAARLVKNPSAKSYGVAGTTWKNSQKRHCCIIV
jgi:small GTP-binding protein